MSSGRLRFIVFFAIIAFVGGTSRAVSTLAAQPKPAATLPTAEMIFARQRTAIGKLPSLVAHWSGTITQSGQVAQYEITAARDGRFRRTFKLPLMQRSEGSNGIFDWEQDENGNVQTSPAQPHSPMDARLVRLNDFRFDPHDAVVLGITDVDGRRAYSVSTIVRGQNATVYFDVATSLIDGADIGPATMRYLAYKRFEGVAVPSEVVETDGDTTFTVTVESADFELPLRDQFDPPAQKYPQFPSGAQEVELNFDSPHGLIVCPAQINGHPVRLLVDSGSTTSLVDADVAKRLNLTTGGVARVQGAGLLTGTVARIDSLSLGGIKFEPLFVQAVPLRLPGRIAHEGIDGILGYDLFASLVVRIAYSRDVLRFIQPGAFTYSGRGSIIAIDTGKRAPMISASIGNDDRGTFAVDTGSNANLVLYRRFADAHRRDFVNPYAYDQDLGSGAGGDFPTRLAMITRLNLGTYSLPDIMAEIVMRESGVFGSESSDGIIGGEALASFSAVFFDYGGKRIILEK